MRMAGKLGMVLLVALASCLAQQANTPASTATDASLAHIEQLKAKAEQKGEADRARIYADIAHELVELANMQFTNGDPDKGQASIQDAVSYAEKAATSAEVKGHKIKNAEITLRETARRIEEVRKTLDIDNQPPLKAAVDRLEQLRKQLLQRMFGDDKK
jgi:polyhydroxyalkanoate synthesis regulator phasin